MRRGVLVVLTPLVLVLGWLAVGPSPARGVVLVDVAFLATLGVFLLTLSWEITLALRETTRRSLGEFESRE